ncbi:MULTISPECIES: hypothetical protein [unclassified Xanthomonas]|uniref:hypothetical protein n=1 Tax=Xanthomonas sp. LMG 9002 TaxID=1591158 RepID=UPI001F401A15|nr:hypothetical protein [Xanthomonas sp. LMG 9002]
MLDHSQTTGSHAAKCSPVLRMSISTVTLLAVALIRVSATQKPISKLRRQG